MSSNRWCCWPCLRLGGTAHGAAVRAEILERTGRSITPGAIYPTLDRLEVRGFLRSRLGEPTPERGGRARRKFTVTPAGLREIRAAWRQTSALATGVAGLKPERAMRDPARALWIRGLAKLLRAEHRAEVSATSSKSESRARLGASGESDRHSGWRFICSAALSQGGRRVARSMFPMARRPHRGFTGASAGI